MNRMIFSYLSLFLALTFLCISSCSKDEEVYADVLSYYEALEKIEPTYSIDFTSPQSRDYLLKGWSVLGTEQTWAEGMESSLFFYGPQGSAQGDIEMTIACAPIIFPGSPEQSMGIYLNGTPLKTIALKPAWGEYTISLPHKLLQAKNIVTFKYAYAAKPCDHLPNSQDKRNLSVMFKQVSFSTTPSLSLKGNRLAQKVGSLLSYYERITEHTQLKLRFKNKKEGMIHGCVKIESPQHEQESYEFKESGDYTIDLAEYAGKITKISFMIACNKGSTFEGDNHVEWSNIVLYTNKEPAEKSHGSDNQALRAVKEQLKEFDIIYIVLDAFAARHSSAYGYHRKTSPTIDNLASKGVLFENMFAPAPYTLASTASLFTSKYPFEHQLTTLRDKLNPSLVTIAKRLSDEGMATYCISAHPFLAKSTKDWGLTNGFETTYFKHFFDPAYLVKEILPQIYNARGKYARRKFLYIHIIPPHGPYTPPERFRVFGYNKLNGLTEEDQLTKIDMGELQISEEQLQQIISLYDANILYADEYIRRMVMYLEEHGLMDKVIVIITADHGEAFKEHGKMIHNTTIYDEMIHVPFVIKFPDSIGIKDVRVSGIASLIDVAPTILDMMGLKAEETFKGESLLPAIWGNTEIRSLVYSATTRLARCIRDTHYKYIYNPHTKDELYDIVNDPLERSNIVTEESIIAQYYSQQLRMLELDAEQLEKTKVDLNKLDPEKIKQLKELGYMR